MGRNLPAAFALCGVLAWPIAATAADVQVATHAAVVETIVDSDFDATWDELLSGLGGRNYEIQAQVREDRTIHVLFQSDTPARYIDCGEITVHSNHAMFGERRYRFSAASSVRYLVADEIVNELVDVERRTSLNAVTHIELTPLEGRTRVRVAAEYAMKIRTREFGTNVAVRNIDDVVTFESDETGGATEAIRQGATSTPVSFECTANGLLERTIVSLLDIDG